MLNFVEMPVYQTGRKSITKPAILIMALAFLGMAQRAAAQDYKVGVGVRLSNSSPTLANSLSAKYFLNEEDAVEGLISFGSRFGLGALYEKHQKFAVPGFSWLYGGGLYVGFEDRKTYFGPTALVGLDYKFTDVPINLTLDYKPELDLSPKGRFIPDAFALSVRFTIK